MGTAASLQKMALPEVLTREEVRRLAGKQYRENVFLEIAADDLTVTRRQFEQCAALAERNLLRYIAVGSTTHGSNNDGTANARVRKPLEDWIAEVAAHREAGNLLEAAVTAQRVCVVHRRPWLLCGHGYWRNPLPHEYLLALPACRWHACNAMWAVCFLCHARHHLRRSAGKHTRTRTHSHTHTRPPACTHPHTKGSWATRTRGGAWSGCTHCTRTGPDPAGW
jgi:hypothetical protein